MVGIQDTGCVTHYDIGRDTSGGTPLPKGWRDARFRKAILNRFTQAWQKRLSILNQTKKAKI
jgi:hypothetical protein